MNCRRPLPMAAIPHPIWGSSSARWWRYRYSASPITARAMGSRAIGGGNSGRSSGGGSRKYRAAKTQSSSAGAHRSTVAVNRVGAVRTLRAYRRSVLESARRRQGRRFHVPPWVGLDAVALPGEGVERLLQLRLALQFDGRTAGDE